MNPLSSGWTLTNVEELGEAIHQCEYCPVERIKYVHTILHTDGTQLKVGRVCAAKLTGDSETPRAREVELRRKAAALARWLKGKSWAFDADQHIWTDGPSHWQTRVVFYSKAGHWWWREESPGGTLKCVLPRVTVEESKRDYWTREIARVHK